MWEGYTEKSGKDPHILFTGFMNSNGFVKRTREDIILYFQNNLNKYHYRIILIFAITVICFLGIFDRDLWTPDEPRVAAISLEMSRNGNLVIPHLAGEPFIEKPPLYFAVAAGLIKMVGPVVGNTGAVRLASALFAMGTLFVTFLLASRLSMGSFPFLSTLILGTMVGFIENFHWIRVDTALSFFVVSAVWCFAEAYLANRSWFLPLAGFFCACAFLSKGLIGPLLISIPWAGLFIIWLQQKKGAIKEEKFFILQHLICILIFFIFSGLWIALLKLKGGQALWHEWFWVNHVGRLTGSAIAKGHLRHGRPFYYLNSIAMYSMPWLPLIAVWLYTVLKRLWKHRTISQENIFLLIWSVGTILFLTLSVTKRSIYIAPALPAFAIMCAMVLKKGPSRSFEVYAMFWFIFYAAVLFLLTVLPFTAYFWKESVPVEIFDFMSAFGLKNLIAGIGLIICLYFIIRRQKDNSIPFRFMAATAVFYIGLFTGPMQAINLEKSMKSSVQEFAGHISMEKRPRVAGWKFSETMLANFYYYCDWPVPQIRSENRLQKILNDKDDEFDSIIIGNISSIPDLVKSPYHLIAEGDPGGFNHRRRIFWVEGNKP